MTATADVELALREELERIATDVARTAGRLIVTDRPGSLGVESTKSSATDIVTVMDQRSQDHLLERLRDMRSDDGILGEEEGGEVGTSGITWVVDPIDGTVNYLYEIPAYAVSVAAVVGDPSVDGAWRPVAGAVLNPITDELFHAHLGGGARLTTQGRSRALEGSHCRDLEQALVATGFGYDPGRRRDQARILVDVLPQVRDIRREGSAALDLCHVASGRVDAYYESGLNAWDLAAGWLVASEAGTLVGGPVTGAHDVAGSDSTPRLASPPTGELLWACAPALGSSFPVLVTEATRANLPH